MSDKEVSPAGAFQVLVSEHLIESTSANKVFASSDTLAVFFGSALPDNIGGVEVTNVGNTNMNYQNDGNAADSNSGVLQAGASKIFFGRKGILNLMRIKTGAAQKVSIVQLISE